MANVSKSLSTFVNEMNLNVDDETSRAMLFDPRYIDYIIAFFNINEFYRRRRRTQPLPMPDGMKILGKRRKIPTVKFFIENDTDIDIALVNDAIKETAVEACVVDDGKFISIVIGPVVE